MRRTFGSVLAAEKGFGSGFDFVRIALAVSILCYHSFRVTGHYADLMATPLWLTRQILVPMFFAVSGFLIAGSASRLPLRPFLTNRAMRILPALGVEVTISALIIGPLVTTVALSTYFSSSLFRHYFLNIVGLIHYKLPGVFLDVPYRPIVNASLWTIPFEFACYVAVSAAMLLKLLHRPRLLVAATLAIIVVPILIELFAPTLRAMIIGHARELLWDRGASALQCFCVGLCVYVLRDRIPYTLGLAIGSAAMLVAVAFIVPARAGSTGWFNLLIAAPTTYLILFVGFCRIPPIPFYRRGDYSYGIYLYGYPLQQIITGIDPIRTNPWANFVLALAASTVVAVVSWHTIEKPILLLRKKFSFVGRRIAEGSGGEVAAAASVNKAVARP